MGLFPHAEAYTPGAEARLYGACTESCGHELKVI